MEFFNKAKAVRLKSHHEKYLVADEDEETVHQSRDGSSHRARWTVEFIQGDAHRIRLKNCYGKYLTASGEPFLLGMKGRKVVQADVSGSNNDVSMDWEPRTEGCYVKLRTRRGKFLRANGAVPPWRNSVTHGVPHRTATQDWVLWEVHVVDILEFDPTPQADHHVSSPEPNFSSSFSSDSESAEGLDPSSYGVCVVPSHGYTFARRSAMELFRKAKSVRLRSHHDKYLLADDDEENVFQDRNGTVKNAKWTLEFVENNNFLRFKSCFGKYLAASNMPMMLGMTGKKVIQTLPRRLDSSVEWEPIRDGVQVRLKTHYGQYLRANGGVPPWRNSVTHDIPHRTATQDWILWDVDIVEIRLEDPSPSPPPAPPQPTNQAKATPLEPNSPSSVSHRSPALSRMESDDSFVGSPVKNEGRVIRYSVANEDGDVVDDEELSFTFKGSGVEELKQRLEEETELNGIQVCSRNPLNGKLYPLRLQLPPNNTDMHIVVVPLSGNG